MLRDMALCLSYGRCCSFYPSRQVMVDRLSCSRPFDSLQRWAELGNDTVCSLVTALRISSLALQQSRERAWPTFIMDLRPMLRLGFLAGFSRFVSAEKLSDSSLISVALLLKMNALVPAIALAQKPR